MNSTKRVILNTGFLYTKMLISVGITLYSTRLILNALGAEDFGIFNLVAGVIAMLSFLNAAMTASTQRYLSYYLGAGDSAKLKAIFQSSVILHLLIGIFIIVILEIAGIFLFDGFLNIPAERISTAKIVYHFMVVSTFFTINAVPYDSAINAHEDLLFDAITGVIETFFKLGIAIWLIYTGYDKLILYGLLMAALTILIRIIKSIFCYRRYLECKLRKNNPVDYNLFKEMFSFAGWNMFGALCGLGRSQGLAIILNLFFGPIVNAAYGVANQVNGQLYAFSSNMLKALNPQIMKSEGEGDRKRMLNLSMKASKYGFFLLAIFAIPLIIEMPYVLKLWLKNVPEYTIAFCRLVLIATLSNLLTIGMQTAIQATGKIKVYQSVVGGLLLLNLPIAWILLKYGLPAYSVLISAIFIELVACIFRLYFLKQIAGLSITIYLRQVILKLILPLIITIPFIIIILGMKDEGFARLILTSAVSSIIFISSIYKFGIDEEERDMIKRAIIKFRDKIFKSHQIHEQYIG